MNFLSVVAELKDLYKNVAGEGPGEKESQAIWVLAEFGESILDKNVGQVIDLIDEVALSL